MVIYSHSWSMNWSTQFGASLSTMTLLMCIFLVSSCFVLMVLRGVNCISTVLYLFSRLSWEVYSFITCYTSAYFIFLTELFFLKFLGECLCPLCTCAKKKVRNLGTKANELRCGTIHVDSEEWQNMVEKAWEWIFQHGWAVSSEAIDNYLGLSMNPIHVIPWPFPEKRIACWRLLFRMHSLKHFVILDSNFIKCSHPISFMNLNLVSGNKYLPTWYEFSMLVMKGECRYWMNGKFFELDKIIACPDLHLVVV